LKIVVFSKTFLPNVGGLENIMAGLASAWQQSHDVTVFTDAEDDGKITYPYKVVRKATKQQLSGAVKQADVFIEANISLYTCTIGLQNRKKWFVVHHLPYQHANDWKGKLKNLLTRFTHNIAVSKYVADTLQGSSIVINNFFHPAFKKTNQGNRPNDLVFLGRLVSDKGVNVLIDAMRLLQQINSDVQLTIIGDGAEKAALQEKAIQYKLNDRISFAGIIKGQELVDTLNQHKILVVPSLWNEPYGIVALEGLACGCMVVASNGGGLPEAVDRFGITFPNGDAKALANAIQLALKGYPSFAQQDDALQQYLSTKQQSIVANIYIDHFKKITGKS